MGPPLPVTKGQPSQPGSRGLFDAGAKAPPVSLVVVEESVTVAEQVRGAGGELRRGVQTLGEAQFAARSVRSSQGEKSTWSAVEIGGEAAHGSGERFAATWTVSRSRSVPNP
jgi:hypothetical protein